tara:strand:+ start:10611 stop:10871 length:261 start_codon:yes stop_codon:yes gene_type:complete
MRMLLPRLLRAKATLGVPMLLPGVLAAPTLVKFPPKLVGGPAGVKDPPSLPLFPGATEETSDILVELQLWCVATRCKAQFSDTGSY